MPSGKNWVNFLYVNIAFVIYIAGVFYYSQIANIKANWPLYRCNPMYMFLADDVEKNFTYCIQTMQTNFMGHLLQPLTFVTGSLSTMMGGFMNDIQNIRAMFNKIRTFFTSIIESIFGVFLNLVIELQRITIGIKDLIGKTIGIMVSLMYVMDGSMKTMNSTWNGPPGQMIRSLGKMKLGKCFDPSTPIVLNNGTVKHMEDLDLGDVLEDGSIVEAILKINNKTNPVPCYSITTSQHSIAVTGSHLVFDKDIQQFIRVEDYKRATLTNKICDTLSCLITNTHRIPICGEIFWDWEDHYVKLTTI